MSRAVRAHLFWVTPVNHPASGVTKAIEEFGKRAGTLPCSHAGHNYLATDFTWTPSAQILTGTVFKLRSSGLPAAIQANQVRPLPISAETDLGEPMCFAFWPDPGGALVHYSHTGPRHSVLPAVLSAIGYPHALQVEPVIRTDMLKHLRTKEFFTGIEFSLSDPAGVKKLRALGASVNRVLDVTEEMGGVNVKVQISMGHTRGEGLVANAVKGLAQKLATFATEQTDDSDSGVRMIKVRASDGEDAPTEELDLLNAREVIEFQVNEVDRSLDRTDCCRKLRSELNRHKEVFQVQTGKAAP